MVFSITLNPSVDHAIFLKEFKLGDTNRVQRTERDAGGKGVNLSRIYAELGGRTLATGFLGGGPGAYVKHVLEKQGVEQDFVESSGETRTNFSFEDDSKTPPTTFNEKGPEITDEEWEELLAVFDRHVANCNWVAMGGSLPPGVPADAFKILVQKAKDAGKRVMLDADGAAMKAGLEAKPHFIKPNSAEAGRILGRQVESDDEAVAAARELLKLLGEDGLVVISRGSKGAVLAQGEKVLIGKSPQVEVHSTIGSGDSLLGGMLWAFEEEKPVEEALRWGLAAGAATAMSDGSQIGRHDDIVRLFAEADVRVYTG